MNKDWIKPKISRFSGEYRWLSNFWETNMIVNGVEFTSNEQWYVYNKTTDENIRKEILKLTKPGSIKRFGRNIEIREDWDDIKLEVMRKGLRAKFTQNPYLKKKLLETIGYEIEEGNNWGDSVWGVNYNGKKGRKLGGLNLLGKLLMELRDKLNKR